MAESSRRHFLRSSLALAGLSLTASACDLLPSSSPVRAKRWKLGLFHVGLDHVPASLEPLRDELARLGYVEGQNLEVDWRNVANEADAQTAARDFVTAGADLIVAFENQTMRAARESTTRIPIIFLHVDDPVANGWVASLARPGGNLTGFVGQPDLPDKRIEYFKMLVPSLQKLLILLDPGDPVTPRVLPVAHKAATALSISLEEAEITTLESLERVFADLPPRSVDGVFMASRSIQTNFTRPIIRLGRERGVPVNSHRKEFVEEGALFSYGPDQAATGRAGAHLIDKILKGTRPEDLPVEQMDVLELVVNLGVARSLGLTIPPTALSQATMLIE